MLTIDEVARRLNGERHGDSYMCSCPLPGHAHGDENRSLSVSVGRNGGIVMYCHRCGKVGKEIAEWLGYTAKDLMPDDGEPAAKPEKKKERKIRTEPRKIGDPIKVKGAWGKLTNIYRYENADGSLRFLKERAERPDKEKGHEKTFLMEAEKDGVWDSPLGLGVSIKVLYHLPEVMDAIREGRTVYIAEGEKDVDNLRALGFCATCSATGGGEKDLTGKWGPEHTNALDGADVVLIPDNDSAGEGYVQWIASKLCERGTRCRIARLTDDMPDLPAKGDFTDWAQILKGEGIGKKELLERFNALVEKAPVYEGPGLEVYTAPEAAEKAPLPGSAGKGPGDRSNGSGAASSETEDDDYPDYHGSSKFCIVNGCLHKRVQNGTRLLAWFVPEPTELIRRDDGQTVTQQYVIAGTASNGHPLPDALVKNVKDFLGPTWAVDAWGWDGAMSSSRGAPGEVFEAIQWAGRKNRKTRTVYAHAGMRVIDGTPCYLYHGGAIGKEDVSVELGGPLVRSNLAQQKDAQGNDITRRDAALAERILMDAYPSRVIMPLLAQAYLAPVYSILEDMQVPPAHVILLDGKTNAGKSTVTGYVASHFGTYYNKAMPASFNDSQAGMRDKLFMAKDTLVVVDDYRRQQGDGGKRSVQDALADMVISAIADHAGRSRENADRTMERERPSRCTCVMTGEVLPNISVSRRTRLYRITVDFGDLTVDTDTYDMLQEYQRQGYFRQCMREFVGDLLKDWDSLPDRIREKFREATEESRKLVSRAEGRFREMAAHLILGAELLCDHLIACGAMLPDEKGARLAELARQISLSISKQGVEKDEALPEERWLQTVRDLYGRGTLRLYDKHQPEKGQPTIDLHGFINGDVVELIASSIEAEVGEILRKSQRPLEVADYQDIYRALAKRGILLYKKAPDGSIGSCKINTKFRGKQMSCIKLKLWALKGTTEEEAKQTTVDDMTETDEDSPF